MFSLESNCFIGDWRTYTEGVTTTISFVVWITRGLNSVTVRDNILDCIALQVTRDSAHPTNKRSRAWIDHMELNYDMFHIKYHFIIYVLHHLVILSLN
jgi:hypothetical protein